jgi:predicted 2-oxoglutarate/Fe(II)-dependent dioxygenase YbiX
MMLCLGGVFDQAEAAALRSEVEHLRFADGRATAGWGCEVSEEQRAG